MEGHPRQSVAVEPGKIVPVAATDTPVISETDPDKAVKFFIGNISDTAITLRYAPTGAAVGAGVVLQPNAWLEEPDYAGAVCAIHGGSGTKNLAVVIV